MNKFRATKATELSSAQKKKAVVYKILRRYDLWHFGVVVKKLQRMDDVIVKVVITEAYSLSRLMNAVAQNDKRKIKNAINLRINLRQRIRFSYDNHR